jgi:hypothetical protein
MWDIAPAQLQTYFNPIPDLPFYWMVAADLPPPIIAFLLAIPTGISAWLLSKILLLLFAQDPPQERFLYVVLAWATGMSASHAVSMLGTTSNDWLGVPLILAALLIILRQVQTGEVSKASLVMAGLFAGLAAGLKLTNALFAVGLSVTILLRWPLRGKELAQFFSFSAPVLIGFGIPTIYWMSVLWRQFDNPLFPFFNNWIHSPWWLEISVTARAFGPHSLLDWLTFPFRYLRTEGMYFSEVAFADWRLPLIYLSGIAILLQNVRRYVRKMPISSSMGPIMAAHWRLVVVFWITSLLIWTVQHSIERYIIVLEILSGALLIGAVRILAPARARPLASLVASVVAIVSTVYPVFGRTHFDTHWFDVQVPFVESKALVLMRSDAPMSFVLPYFPSSARFIGIENNLINHRLGESIKATKLYQLVHKVVREHSGPIYSLTSPPGRGVESLARYGVHELEGSCQVLKASTSVAPIELCRLEAGAGKHKVFELKVKDWGPKIGKVGEVPNEQPDGNMGIWILVESTRDLGDAQLIIGDQSARSTTHNGDLIVASFRPELLGAVGDKPVKLKQLSTGKEFSLGTFTYFPAKQ